MKIGVLADTHIPASADRMPRRVLDELKTCDLIIHAGDITEAYVLRELEKLAPVKAVKGNMDSVELRKLLPEKITFEVAGKRIGVVHGLGAPEKVPDFAAQVFGNSVDVIVFGHSHLPYNKTRDGVLLFNPGSTTDILRAATCSMGIILIEGDAASGMVLSC